MKTKLKTGLKLEAHEKFLLENLHDVLHLELSMKVIEQKYFQLWDNIIKLIQREHPELDRQKNFSNGSRPEVAIGRSCWTSGGWPSGFYIGNIGFKSFLQQDADHPYAGVWLKKRTKSDAIDIELLKKSFARLNPKLEEDGRKNPGFWLDLDKSPDELFDMLTKKDGEKFADYMVEHFRTLAKLSISIDDALGVHGRSAQ